MKLKRVLSIILLCIFLISFCSFSVFADNLNADGFSVLLGRQTENSAGGVTTDYYTFTKTTLVSNGISCNYYKPNDYTNFWPKGAVKIMSAFESPPLVAGHEYELSFATGVNFNAKTFIEVFVNSQKLYSEEISGTGAKEISISFTAPDFATNNTSIRIECSVSEIYGFGSAGQDAGFLLSKEIGFNDNTDNPGWLGKILQNFTNLGDRISSFFSGLTNSISGFFSDLKQSIVNQFNNVKQWFVDLGEDIKGFFTSLKNYLLYFEDPVTLDPNGVPIGADGKPVYTNPFASKIDKFEQTINGWLTQIQNFVNQIGSAGSSVSSYIENGSIVVTGVLGAVPVLTAVLTFALVLLVVRKVVGR